MTSHLIFGKSLRISMIKINSINRLLKDIIMKVNAIAVNEYEHDKKLNQIISSIDNLSNQVNILTNGVVKCFNIIGQQLGIINQSILSLQNAAAINLDKISQIENQQEKRLCELTSSIQNMNIKTKVIIENK